MNNTDPKLYDRERARQTLVRKIEDLAHVTFSTYDPQVLIEDAEFRLRWIECAPEGSRFVTAPMMDKRGVPMGGVHDENLGPNRELREAMDRRRGYVGAWMDAKTEQAARRAMR